MDMRVVSQGSTAAQELVQRLEARDATVGVIGLGYVGLPLCCAAAQAGFTVLGFDIDASKTDRISKGESYFKHIPSERLATHVEARRLSATSDFSRLSEADAVLICVPTPITAQREPDLTYVTQTANAIAPCLRKGQLVVLESTTWPGTTQQVLQPILEATGLQCGVDFFLAFSPEREDPGNRDYDTNSIPKVVGADDDDSLAAAIALYSAIVKAVVPVHGSNTAEAVKLTENIFRSVNIALVNELKVVYGAMGIDVWDVIEAAKSKPFGFMPFYPGPGLGGHCIPIDPFYLAWKAREYEIATRFIELAGEINSNMPRHVINTLAEALDNRKSRGLNGARILVMGIAYKKNVEDVRESPAFRLIEMLEARGANVEFFDPYVSEIPQTREHQQLAGRRSITWSPEAIVNSDVVLIVTDHDGVDYGELVAHAALVVDTRNVCARLGHVAANVVKA